jgi:hypothetical protein
LCDGGMTGPSSRSQATSHSLPSLGLQLAITSLAPSPAAGAKFMWLAVAKKVGFKRLYGEYHYLSLARSLSCISYSVLHLSHRNFCL